MSGHNRVLWSEGMFLRPQHFQQQDRCFDLLNRQAVTYARTFHWGVRTLEIDGAALETGKLFIPRCQGAMPDGTLFNAPQEQDAPAALDIGPDVRDRVVFLVMPVERAALAAEELSAGDDGLMRYEPQEIEVYDTTAESLGSRASIQVGRLKLSLKLQGDALAGYQSIPVARIAEVGNDRKILLDESFIPACIDHRASAQLQGFLRELQGLLRQRADALADRVSASGRGSVAEVADFLLLQVVNRLEPAVTHLGESSGVHPEDLYRYFLSIAGELATFTTDSKRPEPFPRYNHDNLLASFKPVEDAIRRALQWMREPTATAIPLEELRYGIRRGIVHDRSLFDGATFILEVTADMDADQLMKAFRAQSKVGPQDKIRDLVMQALPGVPLRARPNAPRQLPYHVNAIYFEIDTGHELWKAVEQSGIITLHVAGTFPNLAMSLWALKR